MADIKNMNDFLELYFRQAVFNGMSTEQFKRYQGYVKSGDLTGHAKDWLKWGLVKEEPAGSGNWVKNTVMPGERDDKGDLISDFDMSDEDWERLYNLFRDAFFSMNSNVDELEGNDKAKDYLKEFSDPLSGGILFAVQQPTTDEDGEIQVLNDLFAHTKSEYWENYFANNGDSYGHKLFESKEQTKKFIKDIAKGKYKTDYGVQQKLLEVVNHLNYAKNYDPLASDASRGVFGTNRLTGAPVPFPDFHYIINIDALGGATNAGMSQMSKFRENYQNLLNPLVKEPKIRDAFKNYGGDSANKILKQLDVAEGKVDYNKKDSANYIPPKYEDKRTPWEQLKKNITDKTSPYTDKWTKLRGGHIYYMPQAKSIVDASAKVKWEPKDGLEKFLENADKISDKVKSGGMQARDHVSWMMTTLKDLQKDMPDAIKGALKGGHQMTHLANAIMMRGAQEGKVNEAMTTLETLTVIRYGYTTSNTMNALKDMDFTLLSDPKLSFNKGPMKDIFKAMDLTLKGSIVVGGYAITGISHLLRGSRFRLQNSKSDFEKEKAKLAGKDSYDIKNIDAKIARNTNMRDATQANIDKEWQRGRRFRDVDAYKRYLEGEVTTATTALTTLKNALNNDVTGYKKKLDDWIEANKPRTPTNAKDFDKAMDYKRALETGTPISRRVPSDPTLRSILSGIYRNYNQTKRETEALQDATDKRDAFQAARNRVNELKDKLTKLEKEKDNMNSDQQKNLARLHQFWNFLNSGSYSRTGHLHYEWFGNTKDQQKDYTEGKSGEIDKETGKEMTNAQYMFKLYRDAHDLAA